MSPIGLRRALAMELNTTAIVIIVNMGVLITGLIIFIVILLVKRRREHNQHMASLDERELVIAQTQKGAKRVSLTKPRTVLKRSTVIPFNSPSGWNHLPSVETLNSSEPPTVLPHYAPPKPAGFVPKSNRLSWPFLGRRASGRTFATRKIRVSILSTVVESPKPSPLAPVLSGSSGGQSSPTKSQKHDRPSQSLIKQHSCYRKQEHETGLKDDEIMLGPVRKSPNPDTTFANDYQKRPIRSYSMTAMFTDKDPGNLTGVSRPKPHTRSVSTSNQASGNPPEGSLPIPPLEIARIKAEHCLDSRKGSIISRSPSQQSNSSFESGNSYILATQSSPILRSSNSRVQKVAKQRHRNSMIVSTRPFRDTLTLHGRTDNAQLSNSSSLQSLASRVKTRDSIALTKASSPANSLYTAHIRTTPKRKSGSYVTPYGSPEDRRKRYSMPQSVLSNQEGPKRQLSQASTQASSTRSSNGNPFQWDPAPMSTGKPSALKGSPSARKSGHKRSNTVRISLVPTMLGPSRSRSPSPAIHNIAEESPPTHPEKIQSVVLSSSSTRSLPRPPSTSIFAPELRFSATKIHASLTDSSPMLAMATFDHGPVGSPLKNQAMSANSQATQTNHNRLSNGSLYSIPTFPSSCQNLPETSIVNSSPPVFAISRPSNEYGRNGQTFNEMDMDASSTQLVLGNDFSSARPVPANGFSTECPSPVYQPTASGISRSFSSPFSSIPEESSAEPLLTADCESIDPYDSRPCSPKTIPSVASHSHPNHEAYNLPIKDTTIPEEPLDTVDPAILSKETYASLKGPFDNGSGSAISDRKKEQNNLLVYSNPSDVVRSIQPLIDAAFPSSPPTQPDSLALEPPGLFIQSSPSSLYSAPSPSPSFPMAPNSPRPGHAQLPLGTPTINFTNVPILTPCGPRDPPPRSLRSSIQALRRMNSDTKKGGKAERRYANFGREDSIALPGDESWLEGIEGYEEEEDETWDEQKGRALVGDLGFDWEGDATELEIDLGSTAISKPPRFLHISSMPTVEIESTKDKENEEKKSGESPETSSPRPTTPNAISRDRSSSIWEDGERFWASTPPRPPITSPSKPANRFLPLSSSPASTRSPRKRAFDVAKDDVSDQLDVQDENGRVGADGEKKRHSGRYRKRSVLGTSTPNVKINVIPPSSGGGQDTPGSYYDAEGFLSQRYE